MNGSCKRLLNTAVPTLQLHLNGSDDDGEDDAEDRAASAPIAQTAVKRNQGFVRQRNSSEYIEAVEDAPSYKRPRWHNPPTMVFEESASDTLGIQSDTLSPVQLRSDKDDHWQCEAEEVKDDGQSCEEIEWIDYDEENELGAVENDFIALAFEASK